MKTVHMFKTYKFDDTKEMVYEFCRAVRKYLFIGTYRYYGITTDMEPLEKEKKIIENLLAA